ncbi:MAG: hypothetical protein ABIA04_08685 [Pseudomonadota bacterium]
MRFSVKSIYFAALNILIILLAIGEIYPSAIHQMCSLCRNNGSINDPCCFKAISDSGYYPPAFDYDQICVDELYFELRGVESVDDAVLAVCNDPEIKAKVEYYNKTASRSEKSAALKSYKNDLKTYLEGHVLKEGKNQGFSGTELQSYVDENLELDSSRSTYVYMLNDTIAANFFKDSLNRQKHAASFCRLKQSNVIAEDVISPEMKKIYLKASTIAAFLPYGAGVTIAADLTYLTTALERTYDEYKTTKRLAETGLATGADVRRKKENMIKKTWDIASYMVLQALGMGVGKAYSAGKPVVKNGVLHFGDKAFKKLSQRQQALVQRVLTKAQEKISLIIGPTYTSIVDFTAENTIDYQTKDYVKDKLK